MLPHVLLTHICCTSGSRSCAGSADGMWTWCLWTSVNLTIVTPSGKLEPKSSTLPIANALLCIGPCASPDVEGSCVLHCREWRMPFTLWSGRSGNTAWKNSAKKKRRRAASSLKNVLWCEWGKFGLSSGLLSACCDLLWSPSNGSLFSLTNQWWCAG